VDSETLKGCQPVLISSEDSYDDHEATSVEQTQFFFLTIN
jgi:hypothetical protein